MQHSYVVQKGDTLAGIARDSYGDSNLSDSLGKFNGIIHPGMLSAGRILEIPPRKEIASHSTVESAIGKLNPPNGLDDIMTVFGDIYKYIQKDGTLAVSWELDHMARCRIPFSIRLSMDHSKEITIIYCNKKLADVFPAVLADIQAAKLQGEIKTFGGCFNFRSKRSGGKLSTHSWGIAIDLNPETNSMGTAGDIRSEIVEIFRLHGFKWGGDWTGKAKDPMHFQFCTGY